MSSDANETRSRYSRRRFLVRAGAGAGAVAVGGGISSAFANPVAAAPARSQFVTTDPQHFGRLFPGLNAFSPASNGVKKSLIALGAQGGLLDAQDQLSAGPIALITNPALSLNNPDNPAHTAGTHFFGQFVDHDVTFDTSSKLGVPTDPLTSPTGRTPSLDLDSVYGAGPAGTPALYDTPTDPAKLLIGSVGSSRISPRTAGGTAIIGDPRNDEHMMVAGLHCAFILFHNRAVDDARANGASTWQDAFAQARRFTTWHYQWLVLHEFLPLVVGQRWSTTCSPGAGGSTPPPSAGIHAGGVPGRLLPHGPQHGPALVQSKPEGRRRQPVLRLHLRPGPERHDLRADRPSRRLPRGASVHRLADLLRLRRRPSQAQQADRQHISTPLFTLPLGAIASHDQPTVAAAAHAAAPPDLGLPSGQDIAEAMGVDPIAKQDLRELKPYDFDKSTPLWYYMLKEAELLEDGLHLGPVAGRIVAEVLIGLLQTDPNGYLVVKPSWQPTLGASGSFKMTDFLTYAGVDPATRHSQQPSYA